MASHLKELLVVDIQGQADWRTRKAEEYPEDERNARCSVALSRLAESVKAISDDHPLFQRLERLANTLSDDEIYQKLEYGEENRLIRRYGFDSPGVGLGLNLWDRLKEARIWSEDEKLVDGHWVALAKQKNLLDPDVEYVWSRPDMVETRLLAGTHELVFALDDEQKIKYRIARGDLVLMGKRPSNRE